MRIQLQIPTNHNYYKDKKPFVLDDEIKKIDKTDGQNKAYDSLFNDPFSLTTNDLENEEKYKHIIISSVVRKKIAAKNKDREDYPLILKVFSENSEDSEKQKNYIQTGLYAGVINKKIAENNSKTSITFNIVPDCGDFFLRRMLNVINHIYLQVEDKKTSQEKSQTPFEYIIFYLFINSLEKARILGYPQQYKVTKEQSQRFHGQLDINQFAKKDVPYRGKLSVIFRERKIAQKIVDVLYAALFKICRKYKSANKSKNQENSEKNYLLIKARSLLSELKPFYSGRRFNAMTIKKAQMSPVLSNPMFFSFKKALRYAEIILHDMDFFSKSKNDTDSVSGYLIDSSELWEVYLQHLLEKNLPEWEVLGQEEMPVYENTFFGRPFYPDLVLKKRGENVYAVFDAKFKRMEGKFYDVDRNDLHQIHFYAGYYSRKGELKACGLLYPCIVKQGENWESTLYGIGDETKFIITGVNIEEVKEATDENKWRKLEDEESKFIKEIKKVLE